MKLSFLQIFLLLIFFFVLFNNNSLLFNHVVKLLTSFVQSIKKHNSNHK